MNLSSKFELTFENQMSNLALEALWFACFIHSYTSV